MSSGPAPASSAAPATAHPVPDIATHLSGRWTVDRTLLDLGSGAQGTFRGTAVFRPADPSDGTEPSGVTGCLLHIEDGELAWGGTVTRAGRTLRLLPRPDGTADVSFADGRPFHDLDLRTGRWITRHPCVDDLYEGEFTVVSPDEWHLRWHAGGPAKDQLICSVYRRSA